MFRHKRRKAAFQWVFALRLPTNISALAVLLRDFGNTYDLRRWPPIGPHPPIKPAALSAAALRI
jgi:hypothetical protein